MCTFAIPLEKIAGFFSEIIEKTEGKYKKQVPNNKKIESVNSKKLNEARNKEIYKEEFDPGSG